MRPSHHSRSSLLCQSVPTPAAILWVQPRPKNLRRPAGPPKVLVQQSSVVDWVNAALFSYLFTWNLFSFTPPPTIVTMIQTSDKQTLPAKRPIQIGPKVSIQPKPMITAVPLAHAQAPIQAKTIIFQPLQTTVLPVVKPAPVNIQPAPPTGQTSYHNTYRHS